MRAARRGGDARMQVSFTQLLVLGTCLLLGSMGLAVYVLSGRSTPFATSAVDFVATELPIMDSVATLGSIVIDKSESNSHWTSLDEYKKHVLDQVKITLAKHPFHSLTEEQRGHFDMADYFEFLKKQPACQALPVFTSMANVFSELYWQLIENYIYTMVKFDLVQCTLMICVSDEGCMRRCADSDFPCVHFDYAKYHHVAALPSALEQIAALKLHHIPQALKREVNIIMLDLDVGFLRSPAHLLRMIDPKVDMYVQKDIAYVMNRSLEGWRTWFTVPLPNIGIFFVRGNERTVAVFDMAWREYQRIDKPGVKKNPGKDQNKVAQAMNVMGYGHLKWRYFPSGSAVLLDMVYKFNDPRFELGGRAAHEVLEVPAGGGSGLLLDTYVTRRATMGRNAKDVGQLQGAVTAVHTTCYEQKVKVMGLKAVNAFWSPFYYDPTRPTLTKPLVFRTEEELRHEVRALLYLSLATKRALILPNVLGNAQWDTVREVYGNLSLALWPAFRVPYFTKTFPFHADLQILEPGYYYRVQRDYYESGDLIPKPEAVLLRADEARSVMDVETAILARSSSPRLVLGIADLRAEEGGRYRDEVARLIDWATDSVGAYSEYAQEAGNYVPLPRLEYTKASGQRHRDLAEGVVRHTRLCANMFAFDRGNRSCFNKCH